MVMISLLQNINFNTSQFWAIFGFGFGVGIIIMLPLMRVVWWRGWKVGFADNRIYRSATQMKRNMTLDPSAQLTNEEISKMAGS